MSSPTTTLSQRVPAADGAREDGVGTGVQARARALARAAAAGNLGSPSGSK
jgi:hypothetical protein